MSINVQCASPDCRKKFKARDDAAGKRVKCPGCGTPMLIPTAVPADRQTDTPPPQPVAPPVKKKAETVRARTPSTVPQADSPPPPPPPRRRGRWLWYAGSAAALCLLAGLVYYFTLPGNARNSADLARNKRPAKDPTLPSPRGPVVGTYGDWEVQLVRVEYVDGLGETREFNSTYYNFGSNGNQPFDFVLVCLRRECLRDTTIPTLNGFVSGIPTFSLAGNDKPIPILALGQNPPLESQTKFKLIPANGLLGFQGTGEYFKGDEEYFVAVLNFRNPEKRTPFPGEKYQLDLIVDVPLNARVQVQNLVPNQTVELQLAIPGKKN